MICGKAYINGQLLTTKKVVKVRSPFDEKKIVGTVPSLSEKYINLAFKSAKNSFNFWSNQDFDKRIIFIQNFIKELEKNKDYIADLLSKEIAKPINDSFIEIERTIEYIEKTINQYKQIRIQKLTIKNKKNTIYRVPLGVVLAISPFNYPISLSLSKIIPALISGNTVVFKPATNGSLVGTMIGKLFKKINLPKGVLNVVTGQGKDIGDILTKNPMIDMITFTGSVKIGHEIAKHHQLIPIVLELGGNDAAYVRNDANLELAAEKIAEGAFSYAGQRCTAIKRLIVHKNIKNNFMELLKKWTLKKISLPLINKTAADWVTKLINENKTSQVILGGKRIGNKFENTIIEVSPKSLAWQEEAFGPLLPVVYVKNDDEALSLINDTKYGLQNSIFTKDISWASKIALNIQSGSVNINGASSRSPDEFPFLGIKNSGFGVQGITEALISMTRFLNVVNNE